MSGSVNRWAVAGIVLSAVPAWADCPPPGPGSGPHVAQQVVVQIAPGFTLADVLPRIDALWPGTTVADSIPQRGFYLLDLPGTVVECDAVEDLLNTMVADPNAVDPNHPLLEAELNTVEEGVNGSTGTVYVSGAAGMLAPAYRSQYPTTQLGMNAAQARATGRGVMVAVLDTGVDPLHPELAERVLDGFNFVTNSTATWDIGDGVDSDGDGLTDELAGHGTFIAGLIALTAPQATILPVVVLDDDGVGNAFTVAQGVIYAVDRGADVINVSFTAIDDPAIMEEAFEIAREQGVVIVAAAGNHNRSSPEEFPGMKSDYIGVAAVDESDVKAPFSNYHSDLTISAPGTMAFDGQGQIDLNRSVISTIPGGAYAAWSGTSIATAFGSGAAAVVLSQHPEWYLPPDQRPAGSGGPASPRGILEEVQDLFAASAVNIDGVNPLYAGQLGAGQLDLDALTALGPPEPIMGDINHDDTVDLSDLTILLGHFGRAQSPADFNGDGQVDLGDLARLLANFGQ